MGDPIAEHHDYLLGSLDVGDLDADPFRQLRRWIDEATAASIAEPNAMVLSTVDPDGTPTSRTVLLRGLDVAGDAGLRFFTDRTSRKGRGLAHLAAAAVVLPWYALQRQVLARGRVEVLPASDDDAYWAGRPRASRIAARASRQSAPIGSREELDAAFAREEEAHPGDADVARPERWGGYRLVPDEIEFWQGRRSRRHDRLVYVRAGKGWEVIRRQP